jgi:hypothetical protein
VRLACLRRSGGVVTTVDDHSFVNGDDALCSPRRIHATTWIRKVESKSRFYIKSNMAQHELPTFPPIPAVAYPSRLSLLAFQHAAVAKRQPVDPG